MIVRRAGRFLAVLSALVVSSLAGQASPSADTTTSYPWRLSYFPYVTASPNDGAMLLARGVLFRQSRWDSRRSTDAQLSLDGGYSTRNAWLVRAEGDFPAIANGWRLQVSAQAGETPELETLVRDAVEALQQRGALELTRRLVGPLLLAARGNVTLTAARFETQPAADPRNYETDWHGRVAAILDLRDREYDTRRGALLQGGIIAGHVRSTYRDVALDSSSYTGWYGLAAGWLPLSATTGLTARVGARALSAGAFNGLEAQRIIPAWEDDIVVFGGASSNRGLPMAAMAGRGVIMTSIEGRHTLINAPGAQLSLLVFADAGRAFVDDPCSHVRGLAPDGSTCGSSGDFQFTLHDWTVAPGGGVSLRLLRNAILTATVSRADHATRVYVASGWSW